MTPLLIIDVETAPLTNAAEYITPGKPPSNYSKAETIAKWLEDDQADQLARAALDCDLARLTAIGWKVPGQAADCHVIGDSLSEAEAISDLAELINPSETVLVGYNVRFDVMMLRRRALYLGVKFPMISVDKYRAAGIIDLQDILSFTGAIKFRSQTWYCTRFGLAVPDDPLTGADMLTATPEQIRSHNLSDLEKTEALAIRIGAIRAPGVF